MHLLAINYYRLSCRIVKLSKHNKSWEQLRGFTTPLLRSWFQVSRDILVLRTGLYLYSNTHYHHEFSNQKSFGTLLETQLREFRCPTPGQREDQLKEAKTLQGRYSRVLKSLKREANAYTTREGNQLATTNIAGCLAKVESARDDYVEYHTRTRQ